MKFNPGGSMLLAIDIGNTNVVLGVFDNRTLAHQWRVGTNAQITPDEYAMIFRDLLDFAGIPFNRITGVIISTVVPPLRQVMTEMAKKYFLLEPLIVTHALKSGITIRLDNPKELGADRIVNAAAAFKQYGGPIIVVDFGTATTFCAITKAGDYLGGAICPGIRISAEALFQRASKLPRVELVKPSRTIGSDTISAMQSGILYGYAGLADGIIERMKVELSPEAKVVATGGLAELVAPETKHIREIRPTLTLEGLLLLYELNQSGRAPS
jgi:type III pantothenate kinase